MRIKFTLHDEPATNAGGMGVTLGLTEVYRRLGHEVDWLTYGDLPSYFPWGAKALAFPLYIAVKLARPSVDVLDCAVGDSCALGILRNWGVASRRPLLVCRSHALTHVSDEVRREEARRGNLELSWKYPLYWGGLRLSLEASAMRSADLCLLLNEREREVAINEIGVAEARAKVVDNGIAEFLLGQPLEPRSLDRGPFRIAHIGSHIHHKGIHYLAEALNAVLANHSGVRVTYLGSGVPAGEVLAQLDRRWHSRVEVIPTYERESLPRLLKDHMVVVSASLREGFPLGTLEAMACGLAPVVSDIPGPTQYVRDGFNGLVVPVAASVPLQDGIERLVGDPSLLAELRENAHATAQRYSWERIARETLDLYTEALATP